jgi:hypothetical protein
MRPYIYREFWRDQAIEKQKHDDIILESKKLNDERLAKTINPTLMKPLFGKQDIIM